MPNWGQSKRKDVWAPAITLKKTPPRWECVRGSCPRVRRVQLTSRSEQVGVRDTEGRKWGGEGGGGSFILEVAVSVDARRWQLHTIKPARCSRPAPAHNGSLLSRAVEPAGEAREPLKCVQLRALRRKLTSPAISSSFHFWQWKNWFIISSSGGRFGGVHLKKKWRGVGIIYRCLKWLWEVIFSSNCQAYLDFDTFTRRPEWHSTAAASRAKMTRGLITQSRGY